ncbi:MAG: hypothetical protein M1818_004058 [Claussenomyces sp. TS43310]|nr:MAG: hypothetical protein M1818_004058 [Claussenomyces sp. TS43310]
MYKQLLVLATAAFLPLALTHPLEVRQAVAPLSANDTAVVSLALFLEHLEFHLYSGGFNDFSESDYRAAGFPAGFRDLVGVTAQQESIHAMTLTAILEANNVTPVPNCTYSFPYKDPKSFVELANMITTVGIGAYIGGGPFLQDNPNLLTAATAILTVEARHDSFLRAGVSVSPFPTPFDTPLTAEFAYNLALAFVVSCPTYLPIPVLPALALASPVLPAPTSPPAGTPLTFSFDASTISSTGPLYIAFINQVSMPVFEAVVSCGPGCATVPLPPSVGGVVFAVLTDSSGGLSSAQLSLSATLAGPVEIVLA